MRRVVVTGMGIVSSIGNNTQEVLASLREAKSGICARGRIRQARLPLPGAGRADARSGRVGRPPRHALPRRRRGLEPRRHGAGDPRFRRRGKRHLQSRAPASSWARAALRRARDRRGRRHHAREGPQARRPVRGAEGDVVDRLGDARHLVQDQGRELFDLVGLRDLQPLHRQRRRADPVGQAGHDLRRRLRRARLDAVGAVRRHGRDVVRNTTTRRTRPRAPTTRTATASSSPAAPACWCWKSSSTPRRAAPRSTPRSPAMARPRTATTWWRRRARARCAA